MPSTAADVTCTGLLPLFRYLDHQNAFSVRTSHLDTQLQRPWGSLIWELSICNLSTAEFYLCRWVSKYIISLVFEPWETLHEIPRAIPLAEVP